MKRQVLLLLLLFGISKVSFLTANYTEASAKFLETLERFKHYKRTFGIAINGLTVLVAISPDMKRNIYLKMLENPLSTDSVRMFYATAGLIFLIAVFLRVIVEGIEVCKASEVPIPLSSRNIPEAPSPDIKAPLGALLTEAKESSRAQGLAEQELLDKVSRNEKKARPDTTVLQGQAVSQEHVADIQKSPKDGAVAGVIQHVTEKRSDYDNLLDLSF